MVLSSNLSLIALETIRLQEPIAHIKNISKKVPTNERILSI